MEQINKIELSGIVGRINITAIGDTKFARLSLCTETITQGQDGGVIIDCMWFSCTVWEGERICELNRIQRGSKIHLVGRVRMHRYVDVGGCERQSWEVVANELQIIKD